MSKVSVFLDNLGATLLTDESKIVLPALENYTNSLVADSSIVNLAVQNIAFEHALVALAPGAGSIAIRDVATAMKALITTQLPALIAATAAELQATS